MTHGSLFAGIGGFDLGFERAGIRTIWQVEIDPYCRRVLAKHFPDAQRFDDVRTVGKHNLPTADIISVGFPCQPSSLAGSRLGARDARWLWPECFRVICELRPRIAVLENPPGLLSLGMDGVLGDLASIGYDCEWESIPARAFGAEHIRDRIWFIAYPNVSRPQIWSKARTNQPNEGIFGAGLGFAFGTSHEGLECCGASRWGGDVHGIPARVDRIKGLGNAVVPQIAEWIGRRILEVSA